MRLPFFHALLIGAVSAVVGGCTASDLDTPSLAKRPYEVDGNQTAAAPPVSPSVQGTVPAALKSRISALANEGQRSHDRFLSNLPSVQSAAARARGAARSTEPWVAAQSALSALEVDRSPSVAALADLDRLYLDTLNRQDQASSGAAIQAVSAAREKAQGQVTKQADILTELARQLR